MFQTIQVPQTQPAISASRMFVWAAALWSAWSARTARGETVKHLRRLDTHLVKDIDLDCEALWQPRPEIRNLHSAFTVASGCRDSQI